MFNLLPESIKNEVRRMYVVKRYFAIMIFILSTQIVFLIFMFPSWIVSDYKESDLKARVIELDKSRISSIASSTRPFIKSVNTELDIIDKSLEYPKITKYLNSILDTKTDSIKIAQFSYSAKSGTSAQINLQGVSETREALVSFKKNLEDTNLFKSVDLPISNYAKDRNIDFSMSIIISK